MMNYEWKSYGKSNPNLSKSIQTTSPRFQTSRSPSKPDNLHDEGSPIPLCLYLPCLSHPFLATKVRVGQWNQPDKS